MTKEFKERKIKNDKKKYIQISIAIVLVITILILITVAIVKICSSNKNKKDDNTDNNSSLNNINLIKEENKNNTKEENINFGLGANKEINNITNNTTQNDNQETNTSTQFTKADASIDGIQREMTIEQVEFIKGKTEKIQNRYDDTIGHNVKKYVFDNGKTEIEFIELYEKDKFIVYRISSEKLGAVLTRNLKIGSKVEEVTSAYDQKSILYKDSSMIVIGYPGEDPVYASTIKPKLYLYIEDGMITGAAVNIGNE